MKVVITKRKCYLIEGRPYQGYPRVLVKNSYQTHQLTQAYNSFGNTKEKVDLLSIDIKLSHPLS